jgi:hypothetical protein
VWSFARYVHHSFDYFYQIVGPVDVLGMPVGKLNLPVGMLNLPFG